MKKFAAWKFDLLDRMSADPRLSATDFRVGYRLLHYMNSATGDCFPRQITIAADLGLTDRTVRNALVSLRACGWLTIEERPLPKGRGKSNFYHFLDATTGTGMPVNDSTSGSAVPVNDPTTGNPAKDFRKTASGASKEEHVERNPLNRGELRTRTPDRERGTRIPENFSPDLSVALAEGMTAEEAQRSALNFLDYWKSKPGAAGRKLDWAATWRVWARRDAAKAERNGPGRQQRSNGNGGKPKQADFANFLKNESEAHQRKGDAAHGAEPWIRPCLPPGNPR
ncbi:helix-turn-helix domain-containing protein [Rhizobium ruizarguesonis]|uniref:helix-turn-helix domain-containing protein n=1 Tax=Rhizobium ruizarguesonis TaxID=2081791 RepID=UPI00036A146B|nr:helix-turn-helix domain-containing protein [Rhizobium ruizarguesonis]TBC42723.1 helix-turn-helix domain-containing protein [Rhizobium ruizarguesonis]